MAKYKVVKVEVKTTECELVLDYDMISNCPTGIKLNYTPKKEVYIEKTTIQYKIKVKFLCFWVNTSIKHCHSFNKYCDAIRKCALYNKGTFESEQEAWEAINEYKLKDFKVDYKGWEINKVHPDIYIYLGNKRTYLPSTDCPASDSLDGMKKLIDQFIMKRKYNSKKSTRRIIG